MHKIWRFYLSIFIGLFIVSSHANSLSLNKLVIVTEHSPPYQILNKKGNVEGFATQIIDALLAQTPIQYQIEIYPWSRSFIMAKENPGTCVYLIERNPAREKQFLWTAPIVTTNDYFIGLSNRTDLVINNLEDIKKYKVAVLKDDRTYFKLLELGFVENKNLYVINNTYSMLKLLLTRKNVDFVLADTINIEYRAKFNNIDPSLFRSFLKLNEAPVELAIACNLNTPAEVVESLKKAIITIKENGTYDKIVDAWQMN